MNKVENGLADYSSTTPLFTTAFWVAWITVIYSGDTIVAPAVGAYETTATVFSISTAALGVMLVIAGALSSWATRAIESKGFMYGIAALCALGTLGVGVEALIPRFVFVASAAATGCATCFISLRGISLYAEVDTKKAAITACFSLVIGLFIYALFSMVASYYGSLGALILELTMPFLAVFTAFIPLKRDVFNAKDDASLHLSTAFWRLVAFMAIIAFSVSIVRGMYPKLMSAEAFSASRCGVALGLLAMSSLIIVLIARLPRGYSFGKIFYWLFIGSVVLVAPAMFTGIDSPIVGALASLANGLLLLMGWNFLARVSFCSGMSPVRVYGFGYGATILGVTFGFIVGDLLADVQLPFDSGVLSGAMLLLCFAAAFVLLRENDVNACMAPTNAMLKSLDEELDDAGADMLAEYQFIDEASLGEDETPHKQANADNPADGKKGKFLQKCDAIAEKYDLTSREAEVFGLLAKHMEAQAIADELFISFNTTRTHIRKIYAKLGIHSRRELTKLIDDYELS